MENENPKFLYHGTSAIGLSKLQPFPNSGNINGEFPDGPRELVFATDNEKYAQLYSLKTPGGQMVSAGDYNNFVFATIVDSKAWREELLQLEPKVLRISSEGFVQTIKSNGKPTTEWTRDQEVIPLEIDMITSDTVMQNGGQLFFVDHLHINKDLWYEWKANSFKDWKFEEGDGPLSLYAEMQKRGLIKHYNAEVGVNPIDLQSHYKPGRYDAAISKLETMIACEEIRQSVCLYGNQSTIKTSQGALYGIATKIGFAR